MQDSDLSMIVGTMSTSSLNTLPLSVLNVADAPPTFAMNIHRKIRLWGGFYNRHIESALNE